MRFIDEISPRILRDYVLGGPIPMALVRACEGEISDDEMLQLTNSMCRVPFNVGCPLRQYSLVCAIKGRIFRFSRLEAA